MIQLLIGDKHFSSWTMRGVLILRELNVDYDEVYVGLDWPIKYDTDLILQVNNHEDFGVINSQPASGCPCQVSQLIFYDKTGLVKGSLVEKMPRVPVLCDTNTGVAINDVVAIHDYVADVYKRNLLPDNIKLRYDVKVFSNHILSDFLPFMGGMSFANSFREKPNKVANDVAITQMHELELMAKRILQKSWGTYSGGYLFGEFSLADIMMSPIAQQIIGWDIKDIDDTFMKYLLFLLNRESIKKYLDEAREPYFMMKKYEHGTPAWISRQYRYNPSIHMLNLHNTNYFITLKNKTSVMIYELAYSEKSVDEIVKELIHRFGTTENREDFIRNDVITFLTSINPDNISPSSYHLM